MNIEKLTTQFRSALMEAQSLALGYEHSSLEPIHVLKALISKDNNSLAPILMQASVDLTQLEINLNKSLDSLAKTKQNNGDINLSRNLQRLFNLADQTAQKRKDQYIGSDCFILASYQLPNETMTQLLIQAGATEEKFKDAMSKTRSGKPMVDDNEETASQVLDRYTIDLTHAALKGKLDPVIGRDAEIRRTIQVLARRTKNNPVLIGQPGVGKTAIAEGLAQRIINHEVPEGLKNKRLLALDIASMLAGAKYRGEFEERMKQVLKETQSQAGGVILFIDELHTLVGAGRSDGAMDASNMLKPALARGELHCIGATTLDEYRQYIEKDQALERRFQQVMVDEPSEEDSIAILRGLKERYELHHAVTITDPAIIAAVQLSQRYIASRQLPDKAIDLIDEAASRIRMEMDSKPENLDQLERKLIQLKIEREALKKESDENSKQRLADLEKQIDEIGLSYADLEEAWLAEKASLQSEQDVKEKLDGARMAFEHAQRKGDLTKMSELQYGLIPTLEKQLEAVIKAEKQAKTLKLLKNKVTEEEVASVVARWTGIPVESMLASEREKLLALPEALHQRVVGQDNAVELVARAIQRSRAGLADPNSPVGSFLFLGPTGVGKTELCKALAENLFNDEQAMVRIDMSEFMEKHAVARLIGAPPGYVGYEQGGYLTELVRRKPYSVILLDEVEKAHPDVFNILLQVLDDGRLTDGQGRTIDFQHSIIVMTSNLGSTQIKAFEKEDHTIINAAVMDEVRKHFKPEFINRIDDILVFHSLCKEELQGILDLQLSKLSQKTHQQGIDLNFTDQAKQLILDQGYDPTYGARPIKRAIKQLVETPLAEFILSGKQKEQQLVIIDSKEGIITVYGDK